MGSRIAGASALLTLILASGCGQTTPSATAESTGGAKAEPAASKPEPAAPAPAEPVARAAPAPRHESVERVIEEAPRKPVKLVSHGKSHCVPLDGYFSNDGIASKESPMDGNFDVPDVEVGDTFPWTGMPDGGKPFKPEKLASVTFLFPKLVDKTNNNVTCGNQEIHFTASSGYRMLYILGASETDSQEDSLVLLTKQGEKKVPFKLTDWCQKAKFGETEALRWDHRIGMKGEPDPTPCAIFVQTIQLGPETTIHGLRLPLNSNMHIFALTLQK